MRLLVLAACTALALSACKRTEAPATAAPPAAATAAQDSCSGSAPSANPAHDNLNAVAWVQTSVEYRALSEQTYRAAADHLDQALKEKHWDALVPEERGNAATGLKPAVVMDVDETVLDNSPYQARLVRDGTDYDEVSWDAMGGGEESQAGARRGRFRQGRERQGRDRALHLQPRRAPEGSDPRQPQGRGPAGGRRRAYSWAWAPSSRIASRTAARRIAGASWPGRNTAC